eukprot:CAMPEP_0170379248 /NCGR_PEP_ID=MMETSP0117_2-20130122/13240_1 /TAXON_ID=400756 /ORGANISM="Durinskia baltica, Strain CSIRO CS-38" /LENGTH=311 /DNA_ID=CAMNT_0010634671 /DNA_START=183 /DNA_END=1115 /DNA_ORIENTATION=-
MAITIRDHQSVCTDKVYYYHHNNFGMGSDLHTWTQAVCNSMEKGKTLLEQTQFWIWNDREFCGNNQIQPLKCYFNLEIHCPESGEYPGREKFMTYYNDFPNCPKFIQDDRTRQIFRAAAIEYLFSNINIRLIQAAEKEILTVFGDQGVPEDMITVHLRWGDKKREMKLVTTEEYIDAIEGIATNHSIAHPKIFVTTESKEALDKLEVYVRDNKPSWTLFHYNPSVYGRHHNQNGGAGEVSPMDMAKRSNGAIGMASMISLLYAMEAKYYVLTSGSNWSRLIDELRRNVIDYKCGNCTHMVDLREAFSEHNW